MPVKTEKDLSAPHKAAWLKAMSAMQLKNYGYAIQLLQGILKNNPEFLLGRQILRKAEIAKTANKKEGLLSGLTGGTSFSTIKIQGLIKKDPIAAMEPIEKLLEMAPYDLQANMLLKDAALAAKMPELASFAFETIVEGNPKDTKTMHELARHYMHIEQPDKAGALYTKIMEINPNDLAARKSGKDAAAADSMQRGGWNREESTYRDLIKDKEQAISLEQKNRVVLSEEAINQQLTELYAKYEANPEVVDTARRIAELCEQKEDLENAVAWYNYTSQLTNNTDIALMRKMSDLRIKQYDIAIKARQDYIAENPNTEQSKQCAAEVEQYNAERAALELDEAKKRVEQNPTDLLFRFELGEIFSNLGRYQDAIAELQRAQQNSNVRIRAKSLLGKCFAARGSYDIAAKTYEDAASELLNMDNVKKDIIYNLGLVYEKMGNLDKSIECMKQIYEVDYSYLDVAARVEGSYSSPS